MFFETPLGLCHHSKAPRSKRKVIGNYLTSFFAGITDYATTLPVSLSVFFWCLFYMLRNEKHIGDQFVVPTDLENVALVAKSDKTLVQHRLRQGCQDICHAYHQWMPGICPDVLRLVRRRIRNKMGVCIPVRLFLLRSGRVGLGHMAAVAHCGHRKRRHLFFVVDHDEMLLFALHCVRDDRLVRVAYRVAESVHDQFLDIHGHLHLWVLWPVGRSLGGRCLAGVARHLSTLYLR